MHPELIGKKVVTEEGLEVGVIKEIKTDYLGSVLAVISTRFSNYPVLEVPVISLRKKETGEGTLYVISSTRIPIQLLNEIKSEMEAKEREEVEESPKVVPEVPEVPPLEMFKKEEQVEEIPITPEEKIEEEKEETLETPVVEEVEKEEKKPGGLLAFFRKIIEAIKKLFGAK